MSLVKSAWERREKRAVARRYDVGLGFAAESGPSAATMASSTAVLGPGTTFGQNAQRGAVNVDSDR